MWISLRGPSFHPRVHAILIRVSLCIFPLALETLSKPSPNQHRLCPHPGTFLVIDMGCVRLGGFDDRRDLSSVITLSLVAVNWASNLPNLCYVCSQVHAFPCHPFLNIFSALAEAIRLFSFYHPSLGLLYHRLSFLSLG